MSMSTERTMSLNMKSTMITGIMTNPMSITTITATAKTHIYG